MACDLYFDVLGRVWIEQPTLICCKLVVSKDLQRSCVALNMDPTLPALSLGRSGFILW